MTPPTRFELDPERDPWEQQPGESGRAFVQFQRFQALGVGRTLPRLHARLTEHDQPLSLQRLRTLSSQYQWVSRAEAYDRHLVEIATREARQRARATSMSHARILGIMGTRLGERALRALVTEADADASYNPVQAAKLSVEAIKAHAQLTADPTPGTTVNVTATAAAQAGAQAAAIAAPERMSLPERREMLDGVIAELQRRRCAGEGDKGPAGPYAVERENSA